MTSLATAIRGRPMFGTAGASRPLANPVPFAPDLVLDPIISNTGILILTERCVGIWEGREDLAVGVASGTRISAFGGSSVNVGSADAATGGSGCTAPERFVASNTYTVFYGSTISGIAKVHHYNYPDEQSEREKKARLSAQEVLLHWSWLEEASLTDLIWELKLFFSKFGALGSVALLEQLKKQELTTETTTAMIEAISEIPGYPSEDGRDLFFTELLESSEPVWRYCAVQAFDRLHDEQSLRLLRRRLDVERNEAIKASIEAALRQ
jgi:hypothetical protein